MELGGRLPVSVGAFRTPSRSCAPGGACNKGEVKFLR